jgi:hypothetical protein
MSKDAINPSSTLIRAAFTTFLDNIISLRENLTKVRSGIPPARAGIIEVMPWK